MNYTDEQIIQQFIKTIPSQPANTKQLFAIGFVGLTGSGKSFVAQKIAKKLSLYITSNDIIRRFLNELGYVGDSPIQETVQKIAEASSRYLYQNRISHIIDADLVKFHDVATRNARSFGARLYIVHIVCPDEITMERLEMRTQEVQAGKSLNSSRVGKKTFLERKKLHFTLPMPDFINTINTSQDVDAQIANLVVKLKKDDVI